MSEIVLCRMTIDRYIIDMYHGYFEDNDGIKHDIRRLSKKEIFEFTEGFVPYYVPMLVDKTAKIKFNDKFVIIRENEDDNIHLLDDEYSIDYYNDMPNAYLALSNEEESTILDMVLQQIKDEENQ